MERPPQVPPKDFAVRQMEGTSDRRRGLDLAHETFGLGQNGEKSVPDQLGDPDFREKEQQTRPADLAPVCFLYLLVHSSFDGCLKAVRNGD
jgi:hypothetical protein